MIILNIILFIFVTLFYSAVIVGYGAQFKNKIFHDDKDSVGEFGIYGFIILYFISILITTMANHLYRYCHLTI